MSSSSKGIFRTFLLVFLLILSTTAYWRAHQRAERFLQTPTWLPQTPQSLEGYAPILGKNEDAGRLYFPPLATKSSYASRLQVAKYVRPPAVRPRTPMFIGFTNNNAMLVQCVLSYIAAGWPPEDIIIVENTPTMDANAREKLDRDNYFFLDYPLLRSYGVAILQTPVLFTFSQLQNYYLRTALAQNWSTFFWSHMDILVVGDENVSNFKAFYHRVLSVVRTFQHRSDWAIKWFSCTEAVKACDMLVLVNVETWSSKIGQWDPFIPYYISDCDAFSRMVLAGFSRESAADHIGAGHIFDVGSLLPGDPMKWLFPVDKDEGPNSERYQKLFKQLEEMEGMKLGGDKHRNDWQEYHSNTAAAGQWGYDQKAFRAGWWALSDAGRTVYDNKWGTDRCELEVVGVTLKDMWKPLYEKEEENDEKKRRADNLADR